MEARWSLLAWLAMDSRPSVLKRLPSASGGWLRRWGAGSSVMGVSCTLAADEAMGSRPAHVGSQAVLVRVLRWGKWERYSYESFGSGRTAVAVSWAADSGEGGGG